MAETTRQIAAATPLSPGDGLRGKAGKAPQLSGWHSSCRSTSQPVKPAIYYLPLLARAGPPLGPAALGSCGLPGRLHGACTNRLAVYYPRLHVGNVSAPPLAVCCVHTHHKTSSSTGPAMPSPPPAGEGRGEAVGDSPLKLMERGKWRDGLGGYCSAAARHLVVTWGYSHAVNAHLQCDPSVCSRLCRGFVDTPRAREPRRGPARASPVARGSSGAAGLLALPRVPVSLPRECAVGCRHSGRGCSLARGSRGETTPPCCVTMIRQPSGGGE